MCVSTLCACLQEKLLLESMYEVPGSNIKRVVVSADAVKGKVMCFQHSGAVFQVHCAGRAMVNSVLFLCMAREV